MNRYAFHAGIGLLATVLAACMPAQISHAAAVRSAPGSASALTLKCGSQSCARAVLAILNHDRAQAGVAPLFLANRQSTGIPGCAGSYGHSTAMARSGVIWHVNSNFPRASFPRNMCVTYTDAGENVGNSSSGNAAQDVQILDHLMMAEPHTASQCAALVNHACNIMNPAFRQVGIGVYVSGGTTWLTEDFVG